MIINTNLQGKEVQTIEYIRTLTNYFTAERPRRIDQDILINSNTQNQYVTIDLNQTELKKKKKKKNSPKYTSPYSQNSLSIRKIMNSKRKNTIMITPFTNLPSSQNPIPKKSPKRKRSKSSYQVKYPLIPPLIDRLEKNQVDKMKTQARLIYEKKEKDKEGMTFRQKNQKWADFLLRERRWEEEKQNKMMENRRRLISRQKESMNCFTPRSGPVINIEENIKSVKRKKIKLEQQLKQLSLNYLTWQNHQSPLTKQEKSPVKAKVSAKSPAPDEKKMILVQSKREIQFLLDK